MVGCLLTWLSLAACKPASSYIVAGLVVAVAAGEPRPASRARGSEGGAAKATRRSPPVEFRRPGRYV